MATKEVKLEKGAAKAIFNGFNDDIVPKGFKKTPTKPNKETAKATGSKKKKIH